jgi:hypothetical protein
VAHEHQTASDLFIDFSDEKPSAAAFALALYAASASMADIIMHIDRLIYALTTDFLNRQYD